MFGENKWLAPMMMFGPEDGGGAAGGGGSDGGGGGSSVAPSATPTTPDGGGVGVGADAPADSGGTPAPDWSALDGAEDLDYLASVPAEPPVVPPPQEPVQPVVPPVVPPTTPPAQQPPVVPPPAPTAAQPQPPAEPLTAADPWRIAEGLEANRDAVIPHLATTKFALSEEELRELDADPGVAVPKLLSKVFLESQISTQKFLAQAVPGMIKRYNTVTGANSDAEKKFFESHAALDASNPQHRETAARIATVYRQANPGIPLDQLIAEVGPMVMATLRIAPGAPHTPVALAPTTPQMPRGGVSFRPAVNGGGGAPIAQEAPNPWAGMGNNYD